MKKLSIILLFISFTVFGQNGLKVHLGCYNPGDTIPEEDLKKINTLELVDHSSDKQIYNLFSWKLTTLSAGLERTYSSKNKGPKLLSPDMKYMPGLNSSSPTIMIFEDIKVLKLDQSNEASIVLSIPSVRFYVSKTGRSCAGNKIDKNKTIVFKGKLLTGLKAQIPLINQKVILKNIKNKSEQSATTDKFGDFNFDKVDVESSYSLEVSGSEANIKDGMLYISKQDGSNVRALKKSGNNFVYELLAVELSKLSYEKEEETDVTLKNFSTSKSKELTVVKDIYYDLNSFQLNSQSKVILDEIIMSLTQNKTLKLFITSHTDAQGDDVQNMELSQKRAKSVVDYFISKGIEKERLGMKGLGETNILNRCKNGVECSETEHKLNRRTEFKFSKY